MLNSINYKNLSSRLIVVFLAIMLVIPFLGASEYLLREFNYIEDLKDFFPNHYFFDIDTERATQLGAMRNSRGWRGECAPIQDSDYYGYVISLGYLIEMPEKTMEVSFDLYAGDYTLFSRTPEGDPNYTIGGVEGFLWHDVDLVELNTHESEFRYLIGWRFILEGLPYTIRCRYISLVEESEYVQDVIEHFLEPLMASRHKGRE